MQLAAILARVSGRRRHIQFCKNAISADMAFLPWLVRLCDIAMIECAPVIAVTLLSAWQRRTKMPPRPIFPHAILINLASFPIIHGVLTVPKCVRISSIPCQLHGKVQVAESSPLHETIEPVQYAGSAGEAILFRVI